MLFNHGSYRSEEGLGADNPSTLGPVFAEHGYVFLALFRRGVGLSSDQGMPEGELMARAATEGGHLARNRVQLTLLEHDAMDDARAGLGFLRGLPEVNPRRIAVAGHSFGGSLTLLLAAQDTAIGAAVLFGGAAGSWDQSPELRARLLVALRGLRAPVFFIHAANDYSTNSGTMLAEEMGRLHEVHRLVIYPAFGDTPSAGHNLVYRSSGTWEADVFAFLDEHLRRRHGS